MASPKLFDYLSALNQTKVNMLCTDDPEILKGFDPFIIRRGIAQSQDNVVVAHRMNMMHPVTPWMQWNLALHSIPAKKRYDQWSKKTPADPDLLAVSEFYQVSMEKGSDYMRILSPTQIERVKLELDHRNNPAGKVTKTPKSKAK